MSVAASWVGARKGKGVKVVAGVGHRGGQERGCRMDAERLWERRRVGGRMDP